MQFEVHKVSLSGPVLLSDSILMLALNKVCLFYGGKNKCMSHKFFLEVCIDLLQLNTAISPCVQKIYHFNPIALKMAKTLVLAILGSKGIFGSIYGLAF